MKKILSLLIILSTLVMLFACGEKYPAVESTENERRVMFTVSADGEEYEVKYELYRAFFLTYKSEVDGGDSSVWSGEGAEEYVQRINEIIIPKIADIYATIRLAEKIGVDFSSREVSDTVDAFIEESIEGGEYDGGIVKGYGSYEKYLEALRELGLNYSVQILLYHYAIAQSKIAEYYIGTLNEDNIAPGATPGNLNYTANDVKEFYDSDDCVRVLRAFVQSSTEAVTKAESIRTKMQNASSDTAVAAVIIQNTLTSIREAECGMIIGSHSLDKNIYGQLTSAAFSLAPFGVSEVIEIVTGDDNGYHILYRAEKSDEHFEEYYATVLDAYLNHEIGKLINDLTVQITESITYTSAYEDLVHADITME